MRSLGDRVYLNESGSRIEKLPVGLGGYIRRIGVIYHVQFDGFEVSRAVFSWHISSNPPVVPVEPVPETPKTRFDYILEGAPESGDATLEERRSAVRAALKDARDRVTALEEALDALYQV